MVDVGSDTMLRYSDAKIQEELGKQEIKGSSAACKPGIGLLPESESILRGYNSAEKTLTDWD